MGLDRRPCGSISVLLAVALRGRGLELGGCRLPRAVNLRPCVRPRLIRHGSAVGASTQERWPITGTGAQLRAEEKSGRSSSPQTANPASRPQKAAPTFRTVTSATVTTKVTRAPRVKRVLNAATKDPCSTRSRARPPSVAMKAGGVASMALVNSGANRPNSMASRPQAIPAVYCRERSPDAESSAFVGPVRQVDTVPTAAVRSDQAPQATVTTLIGGACPAARNTAMPWPFCTTSTVMASGTTSSSIACSDHSGAWSRSEEHTSELQSRQYLVCRLLLEKKQN